MTELPDRRRECTPCDLHFEGGALGIARVGLQLLMGEERQLPWVPGLRGEDNRVTAAQAAANRLWWAGLFGAP